MTSLADAAGRTAAALALAITLPMLGAVCILTLLAQGRPVFFRHTRTGIGGRLFTIWKFRTMADGRDAAGNLLPDRQRITRIGAFLRRTSLDELPELWNVVRGEMALVGPRPLLPQYLTRYRPHHARRHEVKPGITGWAQVHGRNALSWPEKLDLDVWYVDHRSVLLDLKILMLTVATVFRRDGIDHDNSSPMPEFMGEA